MWQFKSPFSLRKLANRERRLVAEHLESRAMFTTDPTGLTANVDGLIEGISWSGLISDPVTTTTSTTSASKNHLPVAVADTLTTNRNVPVTFTAASLLANDTDADGDTLAISQLYGRTEHGQLVVHRDATLTYHPQEGFVGTDTFQYNATDGVGTSELVTVSIAVQASTPSAGGTAGEFVIGFDPATGRWYGSNLASGESSVLAQWAPGSGNNGAGWRDGVVADFNGDGISDLAARTAFGQWWVGLAVAGDPGTYTTTSWGAWLDRDIYAPSEPIVWEKLKVADVNGDGKQDIVAFDEATVTWRVALSTGSAFTSQATFWSAAYTWADPQIADFNGDGRVDVAARVSYGQWWVGLSTETGTGVQFSATAWDYWSDAGWHDVLTGDYNGDGKQDILGRTATGQWWLSQSNGSRFSTRAIASWVESAGWTDVQMADLNGDGRDDLIGRTAGGHWFQTYFTGTADVTPASTLGYWLPAEGYLSIMIADIDQDGSDDIIGRRGTTGVWRVDELDGNALLTQSAASKQPDWDEAVAWLFTAVGKDNGNLF